VAGHLLIGEWTAVGSEASHALTWRGIRCHGCSRVLNTCMRFVHLFQFCQKQQDSYLILGVANGCSFLVEIQILPIEERLVHRAIFCDTGLR
jgi:hypothetical protein